MMYVRFPLSLRNVEDLLFKRGIDICHETVRFWWNRFGPIFAADIPNEGLPPRVPACRRGLRKALSKQTGCAGGAMLAGLDEQG